MKAIDLVLCPSGSVISVYQRLLVFQKSAHGAKILNVSNTKNLARALPGQPTFDQFFKTRRERRKQKSNQLSASSAASCSNSSWFSCGLWRKFAQDARILIVSSTARPIARNQIIEQEGTKVTKKQAVPALRLLRFLPFKNLRKRPSF
jgi:hypothetical protein